MFEKKYKADNERIEPTRESLLSLSYKMKREQAKKKDKKKAVRWIRPAAAVAAALVVLLGCFQIFRTLAPRGGEIPAAGAGGIGEAAVSQQQAQSPRLPGPGLHSPGGVRAAAGAQHCHGGQQGHNCADLLPPCPFHLDLLPIHPSSA